jgi:hypothetical protein
MTPTICTVITKSHLAYARVLARSVKKYHPDANVIVLLADRIDGCFNPAAEPFRVILLDQLVDPKLAERMAFYYSAFELCCALRPMLHDFIWRNTPATQWVFLDSDIQVVGDMSDVFQTAATASILLNPHNTAPGTGNFVQTNEFIGLSAGEYNAGFLAIRRCDPSRLFIDWFMNRLARFCFYGVTGMFVDQLWLNHVPNYFRDVRVYTHPGANLAHWNLYQRTITDDGRGGWLVDGQPLMFAHFSGWDINKPEQITNYFGAYRNLQIPQMDVWRQLAKEYRTALLENGYEQCHAWPYAFDRMEDGTAITQEMRRAYYEQVWTGKAPAGSPFQAG